jgi:hypothetical protein
MQQAQPKEQPNFQNQMEIAGKSSPLMMEPHHSHAHLVIKSKQEPKLQTLLMLLRTLVASIDLHQSCDL